MSDTQEFFDRIGNQPGVIGSIVMLTASGVTVKTTLPETQAAQISSVVADFVKRSQATMKSIQPEDRIQCLRVRSFKNELLIFPDSLFTLVVLQDSLISA